MFAKYDCSVGTLDIAPPHTLSVIVICVDGVDDHNNDDAADDDDNNDDDDGNDDDDDDDYDGANWWRRKTRKATLPACQSIGTLPGGI